MHALTGERLLIAWERGRENAEPWRALQLLETALPDETPSSLAAQPLARRNALLFELHRISFQDHLDGFTICRRCGAQLEFSISTWQLEEQLQIPGEEAWEEEAHTWRMRPATTADLIAALEAGDDAGAQATLLTRTVTRSDAEEFDSPQPGWLARFERLNASAEIRCAFECNCCGAAEVLDLDIERYLWREVSVAARRLLAEVHTIARAHGWSEQSILSMTSARRTAYLEMLQA